MLLLKIARCIMDGVCVLTLALMVYVVMIADARGDAQCGTDTECMSLCEQYDLACDGGPEPAKENQ